MMERREGPRLVEMRFIDISSRWGRGVVWWVAPRNGGVVAEIAGTVGTVGVVGIDGGCSEVTGVESIGGAESRDDSGHKG